MFSLEYFGEMMAFALSFMFTKMFYEVSDTIIGDRTMRITGDISGEVVTVNWDAQGNAAWSSSNASHAPGTVYANPTTCPNDPPAWYQEFLTDNQTQAQAKRKTGASRDTAPQWHVYGIPVLDRSLLEEVLQ